MPALWVLLASLTFWTSSDNLKAWLSLEPSYTFTEQLEANVIISADPQ
jgi:hypothetical protein